MSGQKVFFSMGMSLGGFIAGPNASPQNPMGDGGGENLHKWLFAQKFFQVSHGLSEEGKRGGTTKLPKPLWRILVLGSYVKVAIKETVVSQYVTHLTYAVQIA